MRLKWILLLVLILIVGTFVILPAVAPTVTVKSVLRDGQVASGDLLILMNQSDMAVAQYDNALTTNASDPVILKKKGEALIKCGKYDEAEQVYHQLLLQNGNDTTALVQTGNSLYRQGNYTGAISYYDTALTLRPDDANIWLREGDAYLVLSIKEEQRLHDIAKSLSKQSGSQYPVEPIQSMDSYKNAVQSYEKAMKLDPKLSLIVSTKILGATQYQVNNYQSLLEDLQASP